VYVIKDSVYVILCSDHRAKASTKTAASPVHRKKSDAAEGWEMSLWFTV